MGLDTNLSYSVPGAGRWPIGHYIKSSQALHQRNRPIEQCYHLAHMFYDK